MVEKQAIGRAYRLGQTDPVRVIRYIVDESIECVSVLVKTIELKIMVLTSIGYACETTEEASVIGRYVCGRWESAK